MSEMNLILERWRKFSLGEQTVVQPGDEQNIQPEQTPEQKQKIQTYGELKAIVKDVISGQRKSAIKSGTTTVAIDQILGLIPGASNAKSAFDFFKGIYNATDDKKTNTILDKINVDDEYSKIVDDKVEMAFIKSISDAIMSKPDQETIPANFNINVELQNWLKTKYNQRTLTYSDSKLKK